MKRLLLPLLLIGGCIGRQGPDLPGNVGQTHDGERADTHSLAQPDIEVSPVPVGTLVWGNLHSTGFFFFGVVVERRDEQHRVIFADGSAEWLEAEALRPDSLGEDAQVHVRSEFGGDFSEGVVRRRLGDALYVRFANGDERWTVLPHVRFQDGDEGVPERGSTPVNTPESTEAAASEAPIDPGAAVLVNYQHAGLLFAAVVTARADDGRLHVVYLDSERAWISPQLAVEDHLDSSAIVHVRRRWEPPEWVRGRIRTRYAHALEVQLDDGGLAWTSLFRIRAPVETHPQASDEPSDTPTE
ncbi:MAG TPA: hypothetical protein ENK57_20700 [Polyangiaceae bacterium]|nr:hypothetical protein [Polyangiaceae bacterium]